MLWVIAATLLIAWVIGMFLHKGGFLHILLLCALAVIVVRLVADRREMG